MTGARTTRRHRSRRLNRDRAGLSNQRLDIQGLRMVAVLAVFAFHLLGWPPGGFVGVDVFFVVSGFLITGNLLRMSERHGNVQFRRFYWNRIRRIVPAATLVLAITYLASVLVFVQFRAHQVGMDALFAFIFQANWWFAVNQTDYFAADRAISPIQHYWSLSIEEQFYFVWPALIFVVGIVVSRKAWTHERRMRLVAATMCCFIVASLSWALHETTTAPTWAYFDTVARAWELGVGALLATAIGALARIPQNVKPCLSWGGLAVIALSLLLIRQESIGFPAPWALLPVAGAALVIAAGVEGEPAGQYFLRNRAGIYIGNISYSLYLVHWPVIVIIGAIMPRNGYFFAVAFTLTFGVAIGSYHFIEMPARYGSWRKARAAVHEIRRRRYQAQPSSQYAALAALSLVTLGVCVYALRPVEPTATPISDTAAAPSMTDPSAVRPSLGPLTSSLQEQIAEALSARSWPNLNPPMEAAMQIGTGVPPDFYGCGSLSVDPQDLQECTWGSATAPTQVVVAGDSIAVAYGYPLRSIALHSEGKIQVHLVATGGCQFTDADIFNSDQSITDACPRRKQQVVDYINSTKPDLVIISNVYSMNKTLVGGDSMGFGDWQDALQKEIEKFRENTSALVLLSAPPADKNIQECYSNRSSEPADCISRVNEAWSSQAREEQALAQSEHAIWIDSRPWFCNADGYCPSFVGSTPTKRDLQHMTAAYGEKIYPVVNESFHVLGLF